MKKTTVEIPGNIAERSTTIETEIPQEQLEIPSNVTHLFIAIANRDVKKIEKLLIADKAVANAEYKTDVTPLSVAAAHGYSEVVSLLLRHNANANKMYACVNNSTVLHAAAEKGQVDIVKRLLPHADVQAKNNEDTTPLHGASQNGHVKVVEILLKNKANVQATTIQGQTPLHLAVYNQHFAVAEILLNHDAAVGAKNNSGHTPLYIAVAWGNVEIAEILLKHNAPVQTTYSSDKTLLHLASQNRHPAVVELLLSYNANINAVDIDNITPLYIAAMIGHLEIIKILLENNADIHIAYRKDKTPLQIAKQNGHLQVVALLQSHQELRTALRRENPDALEVSRLLNNGAILASQDKKLLLNPELSPILAELEKGQISRAFSSIRLCFSPQEMHFDNEFLIICFKNNKDANYFLKTISIIFKPIDCRKTATDFSVRLQWPFSVDETFLEIAHYHHRHSQLEKKLNFLAKTLNASDWAVTAITPGANERGKNLQIFFQKNIVGSFTLEDKQISIMIVSGGVVTTLPMELLFHQEKTMLYVCLRKITDKITEIEAPAAQIKKEELAQKEAEALEKLRLREEMKAKEAAENRGKEKQKERKKSEKTKITSSATEGFPHAEVDDKTPLHKAVHSGNVAQVTLSLSQGTEDINAQTKKGNTALHVAAIIKNKAIFELLMEQPTIDLTLKNEQGKTAFDIAKEKGLIPHHDLELKKEVVSNQPGKENVLLSEEKTFDLDKPKPSDKKSREKALGGKGDPNFFKSPVANERPKQKESVLKDSDSKEKLKPMKTLTFAQWSSHSSSLSNSSSSSGHGPSPK